MPHGAELIAASQAPIRALHGEPHPFLQASRQAHTLRHYMKAAFNNPIANSYHCDRNNRSHHTEYWVAPSTNGAGASRLTTGQWLPALPRPTDFVAIGIFSTRGAVHRDNSQPQSVRVRVTAFRWNLSPPVARSSHLGRRREAVVARIAAIRGDAWISEAREPHLAKQHEERLKLGSWKQPLPR